MYTSEDLTAMSQDGRTFLDVAWSAEEKDVRLTVGPHGEDGVKYLAPVEATVVGLALIRAAMRVRGLDPVEPAPSLPEEHWDMWGRPVPLEDRDPPVGMLWHEQQGAWDGPSWPGPYWVHQAGRVILADWDTIHRVWVHGSTGLDLRRVTHWAALPRPAVPGQARHA